MGGDKDKGRWVFPGQEDDLVADAAAGPPPMTVSGGRALTGLLVRAWGS